MSVKDRYRFAGLDQQRLLILETVQRFNNRVIALPVSRSFPASAIYDELFRFFRHIGIKIVHQHPLSSFLNPAFCRSGIAAWRPDWGIRVGFQTSSSMGDILL